MKVPPKVLDDVVAGLQDVDRAMSIGWTLVGEAKKRGLSNQEAVPDAIAALVSAMVVVLADTSNNEDEFRQLLDAAAHHLTDAPPRAVIRANIELLSSYYASKERKQ